MVRGRSRSVALLAIDPMAPRGEGLAGVGSLLRTPPFRFFLATRFLGSVAIQVVGVTLAWQVYSLARLTHGVREAALAVGLLGAAQFVPLFALALIAGETVDRYDRRVIALLCTATELLTGGVLVELVVFKNTALWPIYLLAACFGASRAFLYPSNIALTPMLVPRSLLPRAIAWSQLAFEAASVIGPAAGGLLCAISPGLGYATAVGLYAASIVALLLIRGHTRPAAQPGSRWTMVKDGLRYLRSNRIVFGAISLDLFAVLFGGVTALLPVFARDVLHVGAAGFGALRTSPAVGAGIVAIIVTARPIRRKAGLFIFGGVALFALAIVVFGTSKLMIVSVLALVVAGGADVVSVFVRQTLIQIVTPDAMRGRVAAVATLFIGASAELGEFESGVAARLLGPISAAIIGGVGALAVTGLWAKLFPALRTVDRLD